jgi:hypothetical protein
MAKAALISHFLSMFVSMIYLRSGQAQHCYDKPKQIVSVAKVDR